MTKKIFSEVEKIELKINEEYHTLEEFSNWLENKEFEYKKSNKKISYLNVPCCFDIEVSSYETAPSENRVGIMYGWTFSFFGYVVLGRTWNEFIELTEILETKLSLNCSDTRLIVYVHNLSYEFQFIRKRLEWYKIFALEKREVVQAVTMGGIEFRCSYKLSGYSLANLSNQLHKYKIEKLVGDLDYKLIRSPYTPLTEKEINYMVHDVQEVVAYIQELIERESDITRLPLTKTGFVRRYCRHSCLYNKQNKRDSSKFLAYRKLMKNMQLSEETYKVLKSAYMGGYTHANAMYVDMTIKNVGSYDLTSAYPAHMTMEQFPMSTFNKIKLINSNQLEYLLKSKACLMKIAFKNLRPKFIFENYLSFSKCFNMKQPTLNNGRIVSAEILETYLTELDFEIVRKCYHWDEFIITDFYIADKGYLPKDLILSVLKLYKDKTELKDIIEKTVEYMQSKEYINSVYGMTVTDPLREEILYNANNEWEKKEPNIEEALEHYNNGKNRFLYYAWGVWITAYTRRTLWDAIFYLAEDYVYSDTDSTKMMNYEKHRQFFERYNNYIINKLKIACNYQKIDINLCMPKNKKGEIKILGIWEEEKPYNKFKTLGAKRYLTENNNNLKITIAGVNKIKGSKYLQSEYGDKAFDAFSDTLYFPKEHTGKNTHIYQDEEMTGYAFDYLGNYFEYDELSSIYMEESDYSLSITQQFLDYFRGMQRITF